MSPEEYARLDGIDLAARVAEGTLTATECIETAYRIIDALDDRLNAFVSLETDEALRQAAARPTGPLAGVPLAMKDCVGFVKGAPRSFGSRLAVGYVAGYEDEIVRRYRDAGLIPVGTTNVPEFSSSITTESVLHGPCRNPWNLEHSTGGSSGGAAAAVACGSVPIAYGNDSAGSIRIPSSCCGVFGFKPSRGRTPTGPVLGEVWHGLMVHHVISRSVRDSALALDIGEGIDEGAMYGAPDKARPFLDECALPPGPLRIAVSDGADRGHDLHPEVRAALERTVNLLESLGHEIVAAAPDYDSDRLFAMVLTFKSLSLANEIPATAAETGRRPGPDTVEACLRELARRGGEISGLQLCDALEYRNVIGRSMGRFFRDADVYLTPSLAEPPLRLGELNSDSDDTDAYLDRFWRYSPFAPLANAAGLPSMSVPLEWTPDGLPVGMMFSAPYANDAGLFRLAAQLESARPWRDRHPPVSAWNPGG